MPVAPQPITLMFSAYRRKVLALLLLRPDEDFHVRELERLTGVPAGSLHRELKALAAAGLLTRVQQGNQVRYQANRAAPIYEELAGIFRKTSGLVDVLRQSLQGLADRIDVALVFGSMARGEPRAGSDVDILVIGTVSLLDVVKALGQAQEQLGREMNPVVMRRKKFLEAKESGDRFVHRLLKEPKLFVIGDVESLGKPHVRVGQLAEHGTDAAQVGRMLEAIRQNIEDGRSGAVSAETRFEAAYHAIMQCALVALCVNG